MHMGKSEEVKEKIMAATIEMLEKSNGEIEYRWAKKCRVF